MAKLSWGATAAAPTRKSLCPWWGVILSGVSLVSLAISPAGAESAAEQVQLRNEQTNQGLSLRLEQGALRLPEEAADRRRAEQGLGQERFQQYQLHQRQQADSAVLQQQQRVKPLPTPESGSAQRSQRQLHQQQDVGQRLQFRLNRRY